MGSAPALSSKDDHRTRFHGYRRSLSRASLRARSSLIAHRALQHPALATGDTILLYWPQLDQGEIDTRLLIGGLRGRGAAVALPVVTRYDPDDPAMEPRRYDGPKALTTSQWGIREPANTPRLPPDTLDAVVVPALGAGRRTGHRIGYGSGYYDAFLSAVTVPRIGLVYHACLLPTVPSAPHDVALTSIITERGTFAVD